MINVIKVDEFKKLTDSLDNIANAIENNPGGGGAFEITNLWNYQTDNAGVIPYRTYSPLTLNDNISNYDAIFLELISDIQNVSNWHASCLTPFWSVKALMNAYWSGYITYTTYSTRTSRWHFTDTTIECVGSDPSQVNGLVNVYGVKF